MLQYDSDTARVEVAPGIAEGAGGQIGEEESIGRGDFAQTSQSRIGDTVGKHRDLEIRLAHALREADFLMVRALDLW